MRSKAPVFVLGCPRSGTTLLYHMLLSSGGFAVYETESEAFSLLSRRFGSLKLRSNRERLLDTWFRSKLFRRSGLERQEIEPRLLEDLVRGERAPAKHPVEGARGGHGPPGLCKSEDGRPGGPPPRPTPPRQPATRQAEVAAIKSGPGRAAACLGVSLVVTPPTGLCAWLDRHWPSTPPP